MKMNKMHEVKKIVSDLYMEIIKEMNDHLEALYFLAPKGISGDYRLNLFQAMYWVEHLKQDLDKWVEANEDA